MKRKLYGEVPDRPLNNGQPMPSMPVQSAGDCLKAMEAVDGMSGVLAETRKATQSILQTKRERGQESWLEDIAAADERQDAGMEL